MRILLYRWGAYTETDIEKELKNQGIYVREFIYPVENKHQDEKMEKSMTDMIQVDKIDAVFSVNYFPVVAKVCNRENIKYISWSYDAPLNVTNIEETLGFETNYVFMFDRLQAEQYICKGYRNVYHLPLAVSTDKYDRIVVNEDERKKYSCDISFVGNLYSDILNLYTSPLTDYQKGYIEALCQSQKQIYGSYILDELLDDNFINSINEQYRKVNSETDIVMTKEALSYAMASNITRNERLTLLGILSKYHSVCYYSKEQSDILKNARYCGTVDYNTEMPKVFKLSLMNLNITLKILKSGIPLRALDIMGCGGMLFSNYQPELSENFQDGVEAVFYESIEDAFEKAQYYLKDKDKIREISHNGYIKVKENYNYKNRFKQIFNIANINI